MTTTDSDTDWNAKIEAARRAVGEATNPIAKAYLQGLVVEYQRLAELENDLQQPSQPRKR